MSIISILIEELKEIGNELKNDRELDCDISMFRDDWYEIIKDAETTIRDLSAKLHTANMERCGQHYEDDFYDEPSEFDEQIKKDYKVKKRECDRAILEADAKVKDTKLKKLLEPYKLILWIPKRVDRFGPKCDKCDHNRLVKITLPSGRIVMDDCLCSLNEATLHYPCKVLLVELSDEYGDVRAWYRECGLNGDEYYTLEGALRTCTYPNLVQPGTSFEILEKKGDQSGMLFSSKEECQAYCDYLNKKAGIPDGPLYYRNGERWSPEEQEE